MSTNGQVHARDALWLRHEDRRRPALVVSNDPLRRAPMAARTSAHPTTPQPTVPHPATPYTCIMRRRRLAPVALALALLGTAWAHVPFFPAAGEPVPVAAPAVSKAYYVQAVRGEPWAFHVDPVDRAVPVQVLVLDDVPGRAARFAATVDCGAGPDPVRSVDVPFYEPFSRLHHRIVAAGALGPSDAVCVLRVVQTAGAGVPATVVVGDEERFGFSDVLGLLDLPRKLERWQAGF